jgi:hypothetical protein
VSVDGICDVDVFVPYPLGYIGDRDTTGQQSRDERVPEAVRSESLRNAGLAGQALENVEVAVVPGEGNYSEVLWSGSRLPW